MEVIIGIVVNTFGIKGEVKVHSNTSFAKKRYKKGNEVILFNPLTTKREHLIVKSYKQGKGVDIVSFENIDTPEQAIKYKGFQILIEKPEDKLEKDNYYFADLLDCQVYHNKTLIGKVVDIFGNGITYTLRIQRTDKKDLLYPFIEKFIQEVDIANKTIKVKPIEGMID